MADEPSIAEQLAEARRRTFEAELATAREQIRLELATAELRAARAETEAGQLASRIDQLEQALGRRQQITRDREASRRRIAEADRAIAATRSDPVAVLALQTERVERSRVERADALRRVKDGAA